MRRKDGWDHRRSHTRLAADTRNSKQDSSNSGLQFLVLALSQTDCPFRIENFSSSTAIFRAQEHVGSPAEEPQDARYRKKQLGRLAIRHALRVLASGISRTLLCNNAPRYEARTPWASHLSLRKVWSFPGVLAVCSPKRSPCQSTNRPMRR